MQKFRFPTVALAAALCAAFVGMSSRALAADSGTSLTNMSLEVKALELLNTLDLTPEQLKAVEKLAAGAADKRDRQAGTGPAALRTALAAFGEAVARGADDDQLEDLQDDVDEQLEAKDVKLDDTVTLTAESRTHAPDVVKLLTTTQVAAYISESADDISDPTKDLLDALEESHTADKDRFTALRDQTADDVALALAGLDSEKDDKIAEQVTALLDKAHALSTSEFKEKHADLQKEAKALVGDVDPLQVARHFLQRDIAELLANPCLPAAIAKRLKAAKD